MIFVMFKKKLFILFADNTNMFYSNSDIADLIRLTNIEIEKLRVWFAVNRLSLNISKTNYMFFGNRILKTHVSIHISKEEISKVEFTIFLGVLIDNKLTWKKHISMIKSKLSKSCCCSARTPRTTSSRSCMQTGSAIGRGGAVTSAARKRRRSQTRSCFAPEKVCADDAAVQTLPGSTT